MSTLDKWKERAAAAERNRASFPLAGQMVDELKAEGFTPRVVHAQEDGRTIGTPQPEGVTPVLARNTDPATSHAAAARSSEFSGKHRAAIFAWLCDHPGGGTKDEIAEGTGIDAVAVARRMTELCTTAGVYDSGETRESRTGRMATVWKVKRA